jgi:2-polyprenyl-3-methyl-5-hydroxy-6-metoxy-1,4-benzoquinol methylase
VAGEPEADIENKELAALILEIRDRVRARYPNGVASGLQLPDLLPILHARDAAQGKVAAIGSVNPRPPGFLNGAIQRVKRVVSRALDWHIREQVEFNRGLIAALEATLEVLNENNRALAALAEAKQQIVDIHTHWAEWRPAWEQRLETSENQALQAIAELKNASDFRAAQISERIQRRLWADLEKVREDYERLIHTELRLIRQRAAIPAPPALPDAPRPDVPPAADIDMLHFAGRFRGTEDYVRQRQRFYVPYFQGRRNVLDLGCGRGEFLEVMQEAGIPARGVELSTEMAAICRAKGLLAEQNDLFSYLPSLPDASLDGLFAAHVLEHLPPDGVPGLMRTAASKLQPSGVLAIETPNPECLAIFATHFYLDPTHLRPLPPELLRFYVEEAGFGRIEVHRLTPAIDGAPSLGSLPEDFRASFFGALDYALIARKL